MASTIKPNFGVITYDSDCIGLAVATENTLSLPNDTPTPRRNQRLRMASPEKDGKSTEPSRRVVPKFSSFKPGAPIPSTADSVPLKQGRKEGDRGHRKSRSESEERERERGTEKRRGKDKEGGHELRADKQKRKERDGRHSTGHLRHRSSGSPSGTGAVSKERPHSPAPESWGVPQKAFFTDTRGDPNNITYGTIHRYSIPDYRRRGCGSVVGLSPDIRIDRDKGDGKGLVLTTENKIGKKHARSSLAVVGDCVRLLRVKGGGDDRAFESGTDFVPLSGRGRARKRKVDALEQGEPDEDDNHYRSLGGLKKMGDKPEDEELEYASASGSEGDYVAAQEWNDRGRAMELVRKVDAEPNNVDAWMEYVNYQDIVLASSGRRTTAAERRSTAEVKLDILGKALQRCSGKEALLIKYMDIAQEVWDPEEMMAKWQQALRDNPTMTGLWTKYINFRQTDFLSFTYPESIKCFSECLAILRAAAIGTDDESKDKERIELNILYMFLRVALLMREAGFVENAIAAFQLMIELNIFHPSQLAPPTSLSEHEAILDQLDEFWDSEVLRVGETGAQGWFSFVQSGGKCGVPETQREDPPSDVLDPSDPFGSWMGAEEERTLDLKLPARTVDEVEEDDPYRVVLFSDLRSLMFWFSREAVKKKLVDAFLVFSGLRPFYSGMASSSGHPEATDVFLRNDLLQMGEGCLKEWFWPVPEIADAKGIILDGVASEKKSVLEGDPLGFGLKNFPITQETLFAEPSSWVLGLEDLHNMKRANKQFTGAVLKMLVGKLGDEHLAVYYLAWVWRNHPESVKKIAKGLLKRFRTSLLLWNGYAQIESRGGSFEAARNVFSTALGMSPGFPEWNRRDAIILWKTWAWEELMRGHVSQAVRILLSIDNGTLLPEEGNQFGPRGVPPAPVLKARRHFEELQGLMLSLGHVLHAVVYTEVRALLEYLICNREVTAALPTYDIFVAELEKRSLSGPHSAVHEICLMAKARLLYYHSTTARLFKMKTMRDSLEHALSVFPNNSVLLGLFVWNEGRVKIENRVRTLVRDVVLKEGAETVIGYSFAIWAEMHLRGFEGRYNPHTVRALFEQAAQSVRTKFNVGLWAMYVEFELREVEPKKAKDVLFRGIQNCPWSKDLVLLAFSHLRSALSLEEMRKLLSIVTSEKELRVHDTTVLEDLVDGMRETQRGVLGARVGLGQPHPPQLPNDDSEDENTGVED